ncbi:hypothetical protein [Rhodococcus opacus]|uniref:AraC family transcriptional regulator n=1 Tax=Rhodococcus opacus TaxID=37919 RepID=A0AAX3YSN8_RHOOP|nr:hypothetical protein [Rhodococcus opacus]WLF51494.1 hypothetical protein Q5707_39100 [Rhodococcus opacus]
MRTTFSAVVIEIDGTMTAQDLPVDPLWASLRIPAGIGAALDAVGDVATTGFVLGRGPHQGTASLLVGANHQDAPAIPVNPLATAIVHRYGPVTSRPIRGRAVLVAGWDENPEPILGPVAEALIASRSARPAQAA